VDAKSAADADSVYPRIFPAVAAAADNGNSVAQSVLSAAAEKLAAISLHLADSLKSAAKAVSPRQKQVAPSGVRVLFDRAIDRELRGKLPNAILTHLQVEPAENIAAWIAMQLFAKSGREPRREFRGFAKSKTATGDELVRLMHEAPPNQLPPIFDNPALDEKSPRSASCTAKICPPISLPKFSNVRHFLKKLSGQKASRLSSAHASRRHSSLDSRTVLDGSDSVCDFAGGFCRTSSAKRKIRLSRKCRSSRSARKLRWHGAHLHALPERSWRTASR